MAVSQRHQTLEEILETHVARLTAEQYSRRLTTDYVIGGSGFGGSGSAETKHKTDISYGNGPHETICSTTATYFHTNYPSNM